MLSVFLQTSAPQQLNPWALVVGASPVVQFVLLILVFMMVMCLYIIGAKWIRLKQVTDQSRGFLQLFWSEEKARVWNAKAMNDIHGQSASYDRSPIATVFRAGSSPRFAPCEATAPRSRRPPWWGAPAERFVRAHDTRRETR